MAERNLSLNGENAEGLMLNRNLHNLANVRFLGYDSMFQFTLLAKLVFFMIFFGMNTEKKYRWVTLGFVVSYYFYHVRDVYIEHYNR
jgi:1-acyl-sn-glycerol-3-phosphate acyltransferase